MKNLLLWLLPMALLFPQPSAAQMQSGRVYEFLNLPATARITALGGIGVPGLDQDLGMALTYPALLGPGTDQHLALHFVDYFDDIHYGAVAYGRRLDRLGNLSFSLQYIHYGRFLETDPFGQVLGEFSSGEYAFMLGWGRQLFDHIYLGANLKNILSFLHEYSSWGMSIDLSVAYLNPDRLLAAGLVARNIGFQVVPYHPGTRESLPFDLVAGVSKKLANAPFRLSVAAHNLHRFDLTYESGLPGWQRTDTGSDQDGGGGTDISDWPDMLMRHLVFGMEFSPGDQFVLSLGYNYRRRQEMKVDSRLSTVGFSWGVGFRIKRFYLSYGRAHHHLAGSPNHISISTNLNDLFSVPD